MPVDYKEEALSRGFISESGAITGLGQLAIRAQGDPMADRYKEMYKGGLIDSQLRATRKGELLAMGQDINESREIAKRDARLYQEWNKEGLQEKWESETDQNVSYWDAFKQMGVAAANIPKALIQSGIVEAPKWAKNLAAPGMNLGTLEEIMAVSPEEKLVTQDLYAQEVASDTTFLLNAAKAGASHFGGTIEDQWERKRRNELAMDDVMSAEAGVYATKLAALSGASTEELSWVIPAVQSARANLSPEELKNAEDNALSLAIAADPAGGTLDVVTMGVGRLAGVGLDAAKAMNKASRLQRAASKAAIVGNELDALTKSRAGLAHIAKTAPLPGMRKAAKKQMLQVDAKITPLTKELGLATDTVKRLESVPGIAETLDGLKTAGREFAAKAPKGASAVMRGAGDVAEKVNEKIGRAGAIIGGASGYALMSGLAGGGIFPMAAAVAGGIATLPKTAKILRGSARGLQVMGDEWAAGTALTPYWKRVNQQLDWSSPFSKGIALSGDYLGRLPVGEVVRGGAAGSALGYGIGYLGTGDAEQAKAMAGSGGFFGTVGGAYGSVVSGSKEGFRARHGLAAKKLRRIMGDDMVSGVEQQRMFDKLTGDNQKSLGVYADTYPDITFKMVEGGRESGSFDGETGVITVNVDSRRPLDGVIAHEALHYITELGIAEPLIEQLVGDNGLAREADGSLAPWFEETKRNYEKIAGEEISDGVAAREYLVESYVDELTGDLRSGALAQRAAGPMVSSWIANLFDYTAPTDVLATRLMRNLGGVVDKNGKQVEGNGLLAPGWQKFPEVRKSIRNMANKMAGRRADRTIKREKDGTPRVVAGVSNEQLVSNPTYWEKYPNLFEHDPKTREVIVENGRAKLLSDRVAGKQNRQISEAIHEELQAMTLRNELPEEGHVYVGDDGLLYGEFISPALLDRLEARGQLNPTQLDILRTISDALQSGGGELMSGWYQKALDPKKRYRAFAPEWKEYVPTYFRETKNKNILAYYWDQQQSYRNADKLAKTKRGKDLYGGDTIAIKRDILKHMEAWKAGESTKDFWGGGNAGENKRDFLNAVLGYTSKAQADLNPFLGKMSDKAKSGLNTIKSFRLDRINTAERTGQSRPFNYEKLKYNRLPEPVYHGTPHKVDRFSMDKIGTGEGAQAYGHGLYFAGDKGVADGYRIALAYDPDKQRINGRQINEEYSRYTRGDASNVDYQIAEGLERLMQHESPAEVISYFKENDYSAKAIKYFEESDYGTFGHLYKVHLKPKDSEFLDWDKPLSEQSEVVRKALKGVKSDHFLWKESLERDGANGGFLTKSLAATFPDAEFSRDGIGSQEKASKALHAAGIKGIRYLDGNSRGQGKGSYNYVIFDDADITILEENGKPVRGKARDAAIEQMREEAGRKAGDGVGEGVDTGQDAAYKGMHEAPRNDGYHAPLDDVTGIYPDDIYGGNASQYYGHYGDHRDNAAIQAIHSMKGKPNKSIKVYRAVPKHLKEVDAAKVKEVKSELASKYRMAASSPHMWDDPYFQGQIKDLEAQLPQETNLSINSRDWVTTVRDYAKEHGEAALNGDYKILSKTVKAKDLFTDGNSIFEFGYDPSPPAP